MVLYVQTVLAANHTRNKISMSWVDLAGEARIAAVPLVTGPVG